MTTITTIGRVTKDFELKKSEKSGCVFANFSLAVNDGYGDNQKATFYECTVFGPDAERLMKAKVKKGSLLQVVGKFSVTDYTRNNGGQGYSLRVTVFAWSFVPGASSSKETYGANGNNDAGTSSAQASSNYMVGDSSNTTSLDDEDLPF